MSLESKQRSKKSDQMFCFEDRTNYLPLIIRSELRLAALLSLDLFSSDITVGILEKSIEFFLSLTNYYSGKKIIFLKEVLDLLLKFMLHLFIYTISNKSFYFVC